MKQSKSTHKQKQGFSLVELLVVMSIIAILMGIVIGVAGSIQRNAAVSKAQAEIADLMNELEIYNADNGAYPADWAEFMKWYQDEKYKGTVYTITNLNSNDIPIDPWGSEYIYEFSSSNQFVYFIGSYGPDTKKGLNGSGSRGDGDDITNRNGTL